MDKLMDPISRLLGLRYKSHPWHGIELGKDAPNIVTSYIEMVPSDTVKYEIDKVSGYLRLDRPQKYSNVVPALYGFLPMTYSGERVASLARERTGRDNIVGDKDPIDICVLTEKDIFHGNILVISKPIGGFRMLDGNEADDKIIAVLHNDALYAQYNDITELPEIVVNRLKHYFLTYKDLPGNVADVEITDVYGAEEAREIIKRSIEDYRTKFEQLDNAVSLV